MRERKRNRHRERERRTSRIEQKRTPDGSRIKEGEKRQNESLLICVHHMQSIDHLAQASKINKL